jgi:LysR family transcriptional regulator, chromosome initiation inhibitor
LLCGHVDQVGLLESELQSALPILAQGGAHQDRITLRIAVNADSLGTWLMSALAQFTSTDDALVDIAIDAEEHTQEWLRSGEVLAAVTAHPQPVQGCNSVSLGRLVYCAVASPAFVKRYFTDGVTATTLARAPSLRFDRKDHMQAQWARRICRRDVDMPAHWFASTQAFVDASLASIGWGLNPVSLVSEHLTSGALVELVPGRTLPVPLYWQHTRLQVPVLGRLTKAVVQAARARLR